MSNDFDFEVAELLRKQVPNDESTHSTLLRKLLAYDPNIKPIGVISNSGLWMDAPFVQKEYQHLFYRYPDHVLLEIVDMGLSVNGEDNSLFDNPAYYTYRIKSTFFSERSTRQRGRASKGVRYCLSCIKESIDTVGYGYFRHFWERSPVCLIHGQPLKILPELGFAKTLKAVKRLLNGKDYKQASDLEVRPKTQRSHTVKLRWNETGRYLFPVKFAPGCLMSVFAEWIHDNYSNFENEKLSSFAQKVTFQYFNYFYLYEFDYRREFASILLLCADLEPEMINSFLKKHVSLVGLELGPRKQGVIREVFAKRSGTDCSTCPEKACALKTHKGTFTVDAGTMTFNELLKNSYTLARVSMQGRPIRATTDSILGAIDVYPEVSERTLLEKIEFQISEVCHT
ncbi:hypothetical protein [Vibrio aestuarianus]|uniref:TniQ family protein n=1 Tax=Vibrio aestuarianus TaxID=28171 RepID=A0A9X4IQ29_9VIBR|nr:hypothetical protein [Vibrio aestuarianus]MDE1242592.1 TniQ family protein [Vibrio aestuarianus]